MRAERCAARCEFGVSERVRARAPSAAPTQRAAASGPALMCAHSRPEAGWPIAAFQRGEGSAFLNQFPPQTPTPPKPPAG